MAAPLAAGTAALLRSRFPAWTPDDIADRIDETTSRLCRSDLRQIDERMRQLTQAVEQSSNGVVITDPNQHPQNYVDDAVDIADNGDGTITINRVTVRVLEIPPVAGGPAGRDADTMSIGFTSGIADTVAVYTRQS